MGFRATAHTVDPVQHPSHPLIRRDYSGPYFAVAGMSFSVRFVSRKTNRAGYAPARSNKWQPGLCHLKSGSKAEFKSGESRISGHYLRPVYSAAHTALRYGSLRAGYSGGRPALIEKIVP
jgi:hypothetical protein